MERTDTRSGRGGRADSSARGSVITQSLPRQQTRAEFLFWVTRFLGASLFCGCGSSSRSDPALIPRELKSAAARLSLVRFSPDGARLAAGGAGGEVFVWSDLSVPPAKLDSGRAAPLVSLTWSPDGLLAMTDMERGFIGWQFGKSDPERVEFPSPAATAVCIAFRPNVKQLELVIGSRDGSLIFLDARGKKQFKPDHRGAVKQAAYSPDGRWLITAGADGQLIWRDAASRGITEVIKAHDAEISCLLMNSDGQLFITGDWNGRLKVWDTISRKMLRTFEQPEAVSGLGWLRKQLVSASWDGSLRLWEVSSGRMQRTIPTGQPIHDLSVDPRTGRTATVGLDRSVHIWEIPPE